MSYHYQRDCLFFLPVSLIQGCSTCGKFLGFSEKNVLMIKSTPVTCIVYSMEFKKNIENRNARAVKKCPPFQNLHTCWYEKKLI